MKIIRTDTTDFQDHVIESTLRLISEQPSDWILAVDYLDDEDGERTVEGTIASFDQGVLVMAVMDQEAQHTGASTEVAVPRIVEIEVL